LPYNFSYEFAPKVVVGRFRASKPPFDAQYLTYSTIKTARKSPGDSQLDHPDNGGLLAQIRLTAFIFDNEIDTG
jgi:hypothetical protein